MKEQDYINCRDLGRISDAKQILRDVLPETSDVISKEEHVTVMRILSKWETELFVKVGAEPIK